MATIARGHGAALAGSAAEPNAIGGIYILRDPHTNQVMRSGRTNDLARRRGEHALDPELRHLTFEAAYRTDVENVQRGLEQMVHQRHNPPLNDIGGVDPRNPLAPLYREAAENFLRNQ